MSPDLSIEPLVGWRVWGLAFSESGSPLLVPAGAGRGEWPARRAFRAGCHARTPHPSLDPQLGEHASPLLDCSCGIYASTTLRSLVMSTRAFPLVSVVGTVSMWGRVIEHERGWRAEFAYPSRLTLVCAACVRLGSGRGKPSFVVRDPRERGAAVPAMAECTDHHRQVAELGTTMAPYADVLAQLLDRYAVDLMPFDSVRSLVERDPVPGPVPYRPSTTPSLSSSPTQAARSAQPTVKVAAARTASVAERSQTAPGSTTRSVDAPAIVGPTVIAKDPLAIRVARAVWEVVAFIFGVAFVLVMCVASLQSCIVSVDAVDRSTATSTPPAPEVTDASQPPTERSAVARWQPPEPPPTFEFVCGRPHGGWIELAACSSGAPLVGFAQSPPAEECVGETVAFTRRRGYSICWADLGGSVPVDPHAPAANPFKEASR